MLPRDAFAIFRTGSSLLLQFRPAEAQTYRLRSEIKKYVSSYTDAFRRVESLGCNREEQPFDDVSSLLYAVRPVADVITS